MSTSNCSAGWNSTLSQTLTARTYVPTPHTSPQTRRCDCSAVAGITMPLARRCSPLSLTGRTSTRSCSIWISNFGSATHASVPTVWRHKQHLHRPGPARVLYRAHRVGPAAKRETVGNHRGKVETGGEKVEVVCHRVLRDPVHLLDAEPVRPHHPQLLEVQR